MNGDPIEGQYKATCSREIEVGSNTSFVHKYQFALHRVRTVNQQKRRSWVGEGVEDLVKSEVAEDSPGLNHNKRQQSETVSALDERKKDIEVTNTYKYKFLEKLFQWVSIQYSEI